MIICFLLAWMVTNGWSYVFIAIGFIFKIEWMSTVGLSYQAFLWLPCTPEKLVTIPLAMWFDKLIYKGRHIASFKKFLAKFKRKRSSDGHIDVPSSDHTYDLSSNKK